MPSSTQKTASVQKSRSKSRDTKRSRSVQSHSDPVRPYWYNPSLSLSSTNPGRARLDLAASLTQEASIKLAAPRLMPRDVSNNKKITGPIKPNTKLSCRDLKRKYSTTINNDSLHQNVYVEYTSKKILQKYAPENAEDIMKKYGAITDHGDILRKYSVLDYDKSMENYSRSQCQNIIQKYGEKTSNYDVENGLRKDNHNDIVLTGQSVGRDYKVEDKITTTSGQTSYGKRSKLMRPGEKFNTGDKSSTTNIGNKIQKTYLVKSANQHLRKESIRKGARNNERKTVGSKMNAEERGKQNRFNSTTLKQESSLNITKKEIPTKIVNDSDKIFEKKFKGTGFDQSTNDQELTPWNFKSRSLGLGYKYGNYTNGEHPVYDSGSSSLFQEMGLVGDSTSTITASTKNATATTSTVTATSYPPRDEDNVDGDEYDNGEIDDRGVRLHHLFMQQARVSTYVPSTPVDRKELNLQTPGSIYEKVESEHRKKKRKCQLKHAKPRRSNVKKISGKWSGEKLSNYGRVGGLVPPSRAESTMWSTEVQRRRGSGSNVSIAPDLDGSSSYSTSTNWGAIEYYEKIAGSQRRAYNVFAETGKRATKPGDLMEVVKYFNEDVGVDAEVSKDVEDGHEIVLGSNPNEDFAKEYGRFQQYYSNANRIPRKENGGSPSSPSPGFTDQATKQNQWKSLDEVRRQSVEIWLKKRGRYLRSKLAANLE